MYKVLLVSMLSFFVTAASAQPAENDSILVMKIFSEMNGRQADKQLIIDIGKHFVGTPYVGKTLEVNPTEHLVVNLRELDCTTFVENVVAIYLCIKENKTSVRDFKTMLRKIRYKDGNVAYENRLHYFTSWVDNAEHQGFAREYHDAYKPFSGRKILNINYMTTHPSLYPMMNGNDEMTGKIRSTEQSLTGRRQQYIPKQNLRDTSMRKHIADGDIIVIVTNKKGLDTSHIGLACWQDGSLHLLNASSIHKKVVIEPMTLYAYMQRHPSQIGIRVIRLTDNK